MNRIRQLAAALLLVIVTPAGGMVHVEAESSAREIVVRVPDTGSGIEEELLPVIFDRFRQGSAHKGGLGLGLSISKEICRCTAAGLPPRAHAMAARSSPLSSLVP